MMNKLVTGSVVPVKKKSVWSRIASQKYFFILLAPALIWVICFCYVPMYGLYMAFINYVPDGKPFFTSFFTSEFVGLRWFQFFLFESGDFWRIMRNTLATSILSLLLSFPAPIIIAVALNEVRNVAFKKTVQTISYLPYFVSWVVTANIFLMLLSSDGIVNHLLQVLGITQEPIMFFYQGSYFWWIVAIANTWKTAGYNSIIYLAAISGINPELYQAATVDGASRVKQIWHITLPFLKPTIVILLILSAGGILNGGFEQQLLMSNNLIMDYADVIDYYTYRYGIGQSMFSYASAVGLFKSVISFVILLVVNYIAGKLGDNNIM